MGEAERYIEYKHLKKKKFTLGQDNNALMALVALNVIFFLLLLLLQVVYNFYQQTPESYNTSVVEWFELPASFSRFMERPWTLLTYMFSDTSIALMRIFSNMLWLWAFGSLMQQISGNDKLIPVYIYGGVLGGLFFIAANQLIPQLYNNNIKAATLVGANASILALATATTFLSPNHRFFTHIRKGIPIWVLLIIYFLIDFGGIVKMNSAVILSHLGGIIAGFVFAFFLEKGKDGSLWMNAFYHWITTVFSPSEKKDLSVKHKLFYDSRNREPFSKSALFNQARIDEILDKINTEGYGSLTEEEKEILKKTSEDESI